MRYEKTTHFIRVVVAPIFLEQRSSLAERRYCWVYRVQIENFGEATAQLLHRYWRITDARGMLRELRGSGVVGEQPVLKPSQIYEYTSGTTLSTPSGVMGGSYRMQRLDSGELFEVLTPNFHLRSPYQEREPLPGLSA